MFEIFRKYLGDKTTLSNQDYALIESLCIIKKLRKNQYILQSGDVWKYDAFVCRGLLKMYYLDVKGQEHIMQFAPENYWTGDRESMDTDLPSKYNIDAIEPSDILLIEKNDFEMLRKTIPEFNNFVNQTIKKNVQTLQGRIHTSITLSSEEKYNNFLKQFPDIASRVPLHMIASYIGISAETLSRIRSQSAKK
ncbi:Crp/Fnr family transcriptional regulator [Dyadobacter sp. 3J3]|uniref:Crp/Fnr family transcriptional regulator n=1 Tax=Dyadobacter sp. 3J3 TaxID=2606600 RepID=UPI001358265F|nr:Crp/Fnr family transcriptional regulator [Dyadobacter sp. 3J3]